MVSFKIRVLIAYENWAIVNNVVFIFKTFLGVIYLLGSNTDGQILRIKVLFKTTCSKKKLGEGQDLKNVLISSRIIKDNSTRLRTKTHKLYNYFITQ